MKHLLGREEHHVNLELLADIVGGGTFMVTGAGGSIGSELCRRLLKHGASRVVAVDNHEPSLFALTEEELSLTIRLGDVRDSARMDSLFQSFVPDVVFHAAALKQVPLLQTDWAEAARTNVYGASNVLRAAELNGTKCAVLISTDKAVDPVSVLGASKRMAELLFANSSVGIITRFGNVLGTAGSVVPKFEKQIAAGGPVTITHADMERYLMTAKEACDLVIAASMANPGEGEVRVMMMGNQVKMVDLANRMIGETPCLEGKRPKIIFTGIRPGERISETLFTREEMKTMSDLDGVPFVMRCKTEGSFELVAVSMAIVANDRDRFMSILRSRK